MIFFHSFLFLFRHYPYQICSLFLTFYLGVLFQVWQFLFSFWQVLHGLSPLLFALSFFWLPRWQCCRHDLGFFLPLWLPFFGWFPRFPLFPLRLFLLPLLMATVEVVATLPTAKQACKSSPPLHRYCQLSASPDASCKLESLQCIKRAYRLQEHCG